MTVFDVINNFDKKDIFVPSQYAHQSIEHFVKTWEDLNPAKQDEFRKLADFCKSVIAFMDVPDKAPIIDCPPSHNVDIVQGVPVYAEDTLNDIIKRGITLPRSVKLMRYFKDGESTVQDVLNTKELTIAPGIGKTTIYMLDEWKDELQHYLDETKKLPSNVSSQKSISDYLCMNLPINAFIGAGSPYEIKYYNILANDLQAMNCRCIKDLFDISQNRFELINKPRSVKANKFKELKQEITNNPGAFDYIYQQLLEDSVSIVYPILEEHESSLSTFQKLVIAVQQITDVLLQEKKDLVRAATFNEVFINNHTYTETPPLIKIEGAPKSKERYRQFLADFVTKILSGETNAICPKVVLDESLIRSIETDSVGFLYKSLSQFCEDNNVSEDYVRAHSQILYYFYNLDFASPAAKDTAACWSNDICFLVPPSTTGPFKMNVLQPLYNILGTCIFPLTIDEIQDLLLREFPNEQCFADINTLQNIIDGYTFVEKFDGVKPTYRLKLQHFNDRYQMAVIAYDRAPKQLTSQEIDDIRYSLIGSRPKSIIRVPSAIPDNIKSYFTLSNQIWTYQPNAKPKVPSMLMYVHDYAEQYGVFNLNDLKDNISQNYQSTVGEGTLMSYVYRFCVQATDAPGIFCIDKEIDNHPEHNWHIRKDTERINFSIKFVRDYIASTIKNMPDMWVSANEIEEPLSIALKDNGYSSYPIRFIVQKYADETGSNNKPFIRRCPNGNYQLQLNEKADISWDTIGFLGDIPFREAIIAQTVQTLRCAPNFECEREEIYKSCKALFGDDELKSRSKIHEVLYYHLPSDLIEWRTEGNKVFFHLLRVPEEAVSYEYEPQEQSQTFTPGDSTTIAKPVVADQKEALPFNARPVPDKNTFIHSLSHHIAKYQRISTKSIDADIVSEFVDFIWNAQSEKLSDTLVQYWYEYLNYKVDKYSVRSTYDQSIASFEKYIRLLSEEILHKRIFYSNGLGTTSKEVECIDYWIRFADRSDGFRSIYENVYHDRNTSGHGEDFQEGRNLNSSTADVIALYVYFYKLVKENYVDPHYTLIYSR